ncbi:MAG: hypothetical protein KKI02_00145 [Planctomycetes bacterium]|nr:hypothetical protein [Planctomycetota bacterium]
MDAVGPDAPFREDDLQDELQTVLAEIEKMPGASSAAVVTLDDDRQQPDDSSLQGPSPPPQPDALDRESAEVPDASTAGFEAADAAVAADKAPPVPTQPVGEEAVEAVDVSSADNGAREATLASDEARVEPAERSNAEPAGAIEKSSSGTDADDRVLASEDRPSAPNQAALLADEELAAALAEIELAAREKSTAARTRDDDKRGKMGAAPRNDQGAVARHENTPESKTRLACEELTAESVETEELSAAPELKPPRHSPDNTDTSDGPADTEGLAESDSRATAGDKSKIGAAPATPKSERKKFRFQIGKKPAEKNTPRSQPPDERRRAVLATQPLTLRGKRLYRTVDEGLDTLNRPFDQLGERTRTLVGYVALTTLIVSILAMILIPLILPHRDAVLFLQERRAALDVAPPVEEPDEAVEGDESSP